MSPKRATKRTETSHPKQTMKAKNQPKLIAENAVVVQKIKKRKIGEVTEDDVMPLAGTSSGVTIRRTTTEGSSAGAENTVNNKDEICNTVGKKSTASAEESNEDDEMNEEEENEEAKEEMNGEWLLECTFHSKKELDELFQKEDCWSFRSSAETVQGKKVLYRCNRVKRLSKMQCDAAVYVITKTVYVTEETEEQSNDSEAKNVEDHRVAEYMLFRKNAAHNHDSLPDLVEKVPTYVRQLIIDQYKNDIKAKKIANTLSDNRDIPRNDVPSYRQVVKILNAFKKASYGESPVTMRQLNSFVEEHNKCPENIDEAFIVRFERSDRNVKHGKFFRFFISTPRLLQQAAFGKVVHADATHKVTNEMLPLLAVGVTDYNRKYHFSGFTLTNHESSTDYALTFEALKAGVRLVAGVDMQPEVLVCDADPAIHNGFKKAFDGGAAAADNDNNAGADDNDVGDGDGSDIEPGANDTADGAEQQKILQYVIVMSYFHITLNIQSEYRFTNKQNKPKFKEDVRMIHLCDNEKKFDNACELFVKKWKGAEPEATLVLQKSFFKSNRNWYIGCVPRVPKTNNPSETFNTTMKRCQEEPQRQTLKQFLHTALKIVRQRSKEYLKDKAPFQHELLISDALIERGRKHKRNYVHDTVAKENGKMDLYMFRSEIDQDITLADVDVFNTDTYDSFDEFASQAFDIWKITFPKDTAKWQDALCTCPSFDENYMCEHIISIADSLGLLPPIEEADYDDEPLFVAGQVNPKLASKALLIDK